MRKAPILLASLLLLMQSAPAGARDLTAGGLIGGGGGGSGVGSGVGTTTDAAVPMAAMAEPDALPDLPPVIQPVAVQTVTVMQPTIAPVVVVRPVEAPVVVNQVSAITNTLNSVNSGLQTTLVTGSMMVNQALAGTALSSVAGRQVFADFGASSAALVLRSPNTRLEDQGGQQLLVRGTVVMQSGAHGSSIRTPVGLVSVKPDSTASVSVNRKGRLTVSALAGDSKVASVTASDDSISVELTSGESFTCYGQDELISVDGDNTVVDANMTFNGRPAVKRNKDESKLTAGEMIGREMIIAGAFIRTSREKDKENSQRLRDLARQLNASLPASNNNFKPVSFENHSTSLQSDLATFVVDPNSIAVSETAPHMVRIQIAVGGVTVPTGANDMRFGPGTEVALFDHAPSKEEFHPFDGVARRRATLTQLPNGHYMAVSDLDNMTLVLTSHHASHFRSQILSNPSKKAAFLKTTAALRHATAGRGPFMFSQDD